METGRRKAAEKRHTSRKAAVCPMKESLIQRIRFLGEITPHRAICSQKAGRAKEKRRRKGKARELSTGGG